MAVEPTQSKAVERQVVEVGWDTEVVTGEVVQMRCVNPENGDVSVSGVSKNDGAGFVSYPLGYAGTTHITVADNAGNSDAGFVAVDGEGNASVPTPPEPPIDVPPDTEQPPDEGPPVISGGPIDPYPDIGGPIPPVDLPPDFWTGNLPPFIHVQPISG